MTPGARMVSSRTMPKINAAYLSTSSACHQASPAPEPPKMVKLSINGQEVEVEQGTAIIQACEKVGAQIPRFCYHERLNVAGNCRMCLVESKGAPKPLASCAFPAMPGQQIFTDTPLVAKAREGVMEFLLQNHPLDCPICDWGGECDLQDQSMRYGGDRARFHEVAGKRAVEDKYFGPLIKTVMTRCIQCTRCVRYANEVAGVQELGTTGRGSQTQIGMYVEKMLDSEMSGNIVDLCPVGALTSRPQAFQMRPWELRKFESVDVLDAVGSNIRVDARDLQVMRVVPRTNDDVNEEWINDKTRYAVDGLKYQRLTTPLIRQGDRFVPATWPEAMRTIAEGLEQSGAKGNEIQGVAGGLADAESLVALKDLINRLGSDNTVTDEPLGSQPPVHGVDIRSNYTFNSEINGLDEADFVIMIGTNPRHEAAVINTRIRKNYLRQYQDIALIGEPVDLTYEYDHLGTDLKAVEDLANGRGSGAERLKSAQKPLVIVGSGVADHPDGAAVMKNVAKLLQSNKEKFLTAEWNGYNFLQRAASRVASRDIGFTGRLDMQDIPKFVYLLNADDITADRIPQDAFVVYQGHHGDVGAQFADVCLPGMAYTEKSATYVNTEGRPQLTRAAVSGAGAAREDWKILRALSEVIGNPLPYDDVTGVRHRMFDISPSLVRYETVESTSPMVAAVGLNQLASNKNIPSLNTPLLRPIDNFYQTDPISRASPTMAKCVQAFVYGIPSRYEQLADSITPEALGAQP
ncbi:hypothetical protein MYAM1_001291 [Malassezia yamatoensis]|uniref:NADH-ubiquinone oxidoreductase 78 kDa subunit, mitochondrial n=1 Tax=Malassezia yamatoensis TaxID=253288 RepID=A0AAJ6CI76_9BASI|nr:hypothetical protein MYAM1_001291 [Malassezia yamatoensis]